MWLIPDFGAAPKIEIKECPDFAFKRLPLISGLSPRADG
jgi:hypothetical protein